MSSHWLLLVGAHWKAGTSLWSCGLGWILFSRKISYRSPLHGMDQRQAAPVKANVRCSDSAHHAHPPPPQACTLPGSKATALHPQENTFENSGIKKIFPKLRLHPTRPIWKRVSWLIRCENTKYISHKGSKGTLA